MIYMVYKPYLCVRDPYNLLLLTPSSHNLQGADSDSDSASSVSSITPDSSSSASDDSLELLGAAGHHGGPVFLPDLNGISILSFTPAFTFCLLPVPTTPTKQRPIYVPSATRTPTPAPTPTPPPMAQLGTGPNAPKKRNKIAEMSRKIQKKITSKKAHISKYLKKLDPIKENEKNNDQNVTRQKSKGKSDNKKASSDKGSQKSVTTQTAHVDEQQQGIGQTAEGQTEGEGHGEGLGHTVLGAITPDMVRIQDINP